MPEEKEPKKIIPRARISFPDWKDAIELWEKGDATLKQLSEKYGLTPESFSRKFKEHGIKKGSRYEEHRKASEEAYKKRVISNVEARADRIVETENESYTWTRNLELMTMREVAKCEKDKTKVEKSTGNLKALGIAMNTIKVGTEIRCKILGMDGVEESDVDLPTLAIEVLNNDQIKELRENNFTIPEQDGGIAINQSEVEFTVDELESDTKES